jgi:hypothetical protein
MTWPIFVTVVASALTLICNVMINVGVVYWTNSPSISGYGLNLIAALVATLNWTAIWALLSLCRLLRSIPCSSRGRHSEPSAYPWVDKLLTGRDSSSLAVSSVPLMAAESEQRGEAAAAPKQTFQAPQKCRDLIPARLMVSFLLIFALGLTLNTMFTLYSSDPSRTPPVVQVCD